MDYRTHRLLLRLDKLVASLRELNNGVENSTATSSTSATYLSLVYLCLRQRLLEYTFAAPAVTLSSMTKNTSLPILKALGRLHFSSSKSSNDLATKYRFCLRCLVVVILVTSRRFFTKDSSADIVRKASAAKLIFASAYKAYLDGLEMEITNPPPSSCNYKGLKVTQFVPSNITRINERTLAAVRCLDQGAQLACVAEESPELVTRQSYATIIEAGKALEHPSARAITEFHESDWPVQRTPKS